MPKKKAAPAAKKATKPRKVEASADLTVESSVATPAPDPIPGALTCNRGFWVGMTQVLRKNARYTPEEAGALIAAALYRAKVLS